METLPSELLDEITSYLDFNDRKTLRCLNKALAHHFTPQIFFSVAIWLQKDSVDILSHISQQQHLREHVKHLRIAFELFYLDHKTWGITYCGPGLLCDEWGLYHECGGCDCYQGMTVEEGQHIVQDQKWIDNPEDGIKQLGQALRNLPNLTSVEISGQRPKYTGSHQLINPVTSMYGSNSYADWYNLSGKKQFEIFMRAVAEAGDSFQLRDLSIRDVADSLCGQRDHLSGVHAGIIFQSPEYLGLAALALRRVERLTWSYPINIRSFADNQQRALNSLLRTMPLLKEMSFSDSSRHYTSFSIKDVFGDIIWKNLHTLKLHRLQFSGREIHDFGVRHSSTLRALSVGCAKISYPTFKFFQIKLRESLNLDSFTLFHDVSIDTGKGEWKIPVWYGCGGEGAQAQYRTLVKAVNEFVTRKADNYPHEILRQSMEMIQNYSSGTEFVEDETEDEGEME